LDRCRHRRKRRQDSLPRVIYVIRLWIRILDDNFMRTSETLKIVVSGRQREIEDKKESLLDDIRVEGVV